MKTSDRNYMQWLRPAFALLLIGFAYFYKLDQPPLWGDESETGIAARNIQHFGYPTAFDGRNLTLYDNGAGLNQHLVFKKIPWLQFYAGALSMLIFGNNTLGLRILFALCGLLSFFPLHALLKFRVKFPTATAVLVLVAPQITLLQRNARYYPLLILLYATLLWHVFRDFKSPLIRRISAAILFLLLFFTHPLAALCSAFSLIAFCALFRRSEFISYTTGCFAGFASWFAWYQLLGPSLSESPLSLSLLRTNLALWCKNFAIGIWATIVDMDAVNCMPVLLWAIFLVVAIVKGRAFIRNIFREPLYVFVLLNIVVQALACAMLFGYETPLKYSLLRYQPHLLMAGLLITFLLLNSVLTNKGLYLAGCFFAVLSNFLTVSFWMSPLSRNIPGTWFFPVYSEIIRPPASAWDPVIALFKTGPPSPDPVIATVPSWTLETAIYYMGDNYLIHPALHEPNVSVTQILQSRMGEQTFDKLFNQPEWILDFGNVLQSIPGYDLSAEISTQQNRPMDTSRPELTRHIFPRAGHELTVKVFQLQKR